ncbi:MAG: hypothetical protein J6T74_02370 [Clostridia bacterium]|nr:hypothetical protein [Clostridia bacterium]
MIKKITKNLILAVLVLLLCFGTIPNKFAHAEANNCFYCDTSYLDGGAGDGGTYHSETVTCDYYLKDECYLTLLCPIYTNLSQPNSCAPLAGSIIVGYYDFYCPDLLENYQSFYYYNGYYHFKPQNSQVIAMKEYLYDLMGTNSLNPGTSVSQFQTGLSAYATEQGYSTSYSSCGTINISNVTTAIGQERPIVLFLSSYDYYEIITEGSDYVYFSGFQKSVGHVVVAYGYVKYRFYSNNVNFRTDEYLAVAFGDGTEGLLKICSDTTIDASYSVYIY